MSRYQHDTHFTLHEANAMIPWLSEKLERIRALLVRLDEIGFDPVKVTWSPAGNGHTNHPAPDEYREMLELIAEVDGKGVLLTNFRMGLVNIPHLNEKGVEVYLSWMLDEPKVGYIHRIGERFMDREGIKGRPRAKKQGD